MDNHISSDKFRNYMGEFATGVVIVTAIDNNQNKSGITINSFCSVSLKPQLISFCIDKRASNYDFFVNSDKFVINILRESQKDISSKFAKPLALNWSEINYQTKDNLVYLKDCLVAISCENYIKYNGGDHTIILGEVKNILEENQSEPLLYYRGDYAKLDI